MKKNRYLFRIIIPAVPKFNIYKWMLKMTTGLGAIMIATCASKLFCWDVEVIDENNCAGKSGRRFCPRDEDGRPNHVRLQKERPADAIGISWSLTCAAARVKELVDFYHSRGVKIIAGGKHAENTPRAALDMGINAVVFGAGEYAVPEILAAWQNESPLEEISGIAFLQNGAIIKTDQEPIGNLDELPFPDFNLLLYAKLAYYPISWWRGCPFRCEFCAVNEPASSSSPEFFFAQIKHLAITQSARNFFIVDDLFGGELIGNRKKNQICRGQVIKLCQLLADFQKEYEVKLNFNVQIRLDAAKYPELLQAMRQANINMACIGFESPIMENLLAMRKGYTVEDMLDWTAVYKKLGFIVHGMFIFGYPAKEKSVPLTIKEQIKAYLTFISKAKLDTIQILLTVPLVGTPLRLRLEQEERILYQIGDEFYDGQWLVYDPLDVNAAALQQAPTKIMGSFYRGGSIFKLILSIVPGFPFIVFPSIATLPLLRVRHIAGAYQFWRKFFWRNAAMKFSGSFIVWGWIKIFEEKGFQKILVQAIAENNKKRT